MAVRHEADVLAVRLVGGDETDLAGDLAHAALRQGPKRKPDHGELSRRHSVEKIALVARRVGAPEQPATATRQLPGHAIVAGGQRVGTEIARRLQQVAEFHGIVARGTGDGRLPGGVARGERLDDRSAETRLVIEHVMGNAERRGDGARIADVAPGAAGPLASRRTAIVVELERHADHVVALSLQDRGDDAGIDAARHGDDDTGRGGWLVEIEAVHVCVRERAHLVDRETSGSGVLISAALGFAQDARSGRPRPIVFQSETNNRRSLSI